MGNPEYPLSSRALSEIVNEKDFLPDPAKISIVTSDALDLYFSDDIFDKSEIQDVLGDVTLPFLRRAQIGILQYPHTIDRLGLISPEDKELLVRRQEIARISTDDILTHQAFDYTRIAFSALPDYSSSPYFPMGFSRRGIFSPPQTVKSFIQRVDELGTQISLITQGITQPDEIRKPNILLWRTTAFFEVAKELSLRNFSRGDFNQMLDGVNIEL